MYITPLLHVPALPITPDPDVYQIFPRGDGFDIWCGRQLTISMKTEDIPFLEYCLAKLREIPVKGVHVDEVA